MSIGDFRIVGLPSFRCLSSARCRTESPSCWHRNAAAKAPDATCRDIFKSRFRVKAGGAIILVWVYCFVYFLLMCLLKWTPMDTLPSNQLSLPHCLSFESQCWQCWLTISPFAFVKHAKKKGLYPSTVYPIVRTVYMHTIRHVRLRCKNIRFVNLIPIDNWVFLKLPFIVDLPIKNGDFP